MSIKVGTNNIVIYIGTTQISKIYLGSNLVYNAAS